MSERGVVAENIIQGSAFGECREEVRQGAYCDTGRKEAIAKVDTQLFADRLETVIDSAVEF